MGDLRGRSALITGSTQGVGQAIAQAVARAGGRVVLHGLADDVTAREACREIEQSGELAGFVSGDLRGGLPDSAIHVAGHAVDHCADIDLLVCNAGTYMDQPFLEMDFATFDGTMKLNVYSYFVLCQWFARRWAEQGTNGRILLVGSINGRLAEPNHVAYDTSKGAVEMMVRSLCVALAPHNIRVNGIAPGLFETPLTAAALADPAVRSWMEWHTPSCVVPQADVCGEAAVFLLSDAARHIHGHMLMVDGGMSAWQQPDPPAGWRAKREGGGEKSVEDDDS